MHQIQIELSDQLFDRAQRRAVEAGFSGPDAILADVVSVELAAEIENLDCRFTPEVLAELDRVSAGVRAGAKTYTQGEVDEHLRKQSEAWQLNRSECTSFRNS